MCEYASLMVPFHWNQKSGEGPPNGIEECEYKATEEYEQNIKWTRKVGEGNSDWKIEKPEEGEEGEETLCDYDMSESGGKIAVLENHLLINIQLQIKTTLHNVMKPTKPLQKKIGVEA